MIKFSIFGLFLIVCLACKKEKQDTDCIDAQKIEVNKACIQIYQPVCGCDNKTYWNSCYAGINGLVRWTEGACIWKKIIKVEAMNGFWL